MKPSPEVDHLLQALLIKVEMLEAEQRQMLALLRHGVTPPEWVSAEALALSLGIKPRAVEFYRYDVGVIPVDGQACRKMGRRYEYRVEECRWRIDEYKSLPTETRKMLKESWQQSREVA
jgi:hypothetical protein